MGSTDAARRAGMSAAKTETASTPSPAQNKLTGSCAESW
jgi:hypothetical protein